MNLKIKLTILSFLQFFVWGAWLITIGVYWFATKQWGGAEFGKVFATLGIASLIMPALIGIIADRWINAEKLFGVLHILYGLVLLFLPQITNPNDFFWVMLLAMAFYMPTISLSNSIAYYILKNNNFDVVKEFPPIRVWGTIGFIIAMWITNLSGNKATGEQFYIAAVVAFVLGIFAFTLPKCPPQNKIPQNATLIEKLGLNAFSLFKDYKMALFFLFSMFLGGALQLTNMYGDTFISDFGYFEQFRTSWVVEKSTVIMSISQISETLFILAIPFFLKRFGIKKVMLISMIAWVLRFGFFGIAIPEGMGLVLIISSCIVYGMAFDFFNVSGSLYIETTTDYKVRSSAQGLFMMMTNGFGAILGSLVSGWMIAKYFTFEFTDVNKLLAHFHTNLDNPHIKDLLAGNSISSQGMLEKTVYVKDWEPIWLAFAAYALVIALLFAILFKHKHSPEVIAKATH